MSGYVKRYYFKIKQIIYKTRGQNVKKTGFGLLKNTGLPKPCAMHIWSMYAAVRSVCIYIYMCMYILTLYTNLVFFNCPLLPDWTLATHVVTSTG